MHHSPDLSSDMATSALAQGRDELRGKTESEELDLVSATFLDGPEPRDPSAYPPLPS